MDIDETARVRSEMISEQTDVLRLSLATYYLDTAEIFRIRYNPEWDMWHLEEPDEVLFGVYISQATPFLEYLLDDETVVL